MQHIGEQHIEVHVFAARQVGKQWIGECGFVLRNEAQRGLVRELQVPLLADDVVVEGAEAGQFVRKACPQVRVLDSDAFSGAYDRAELKIGSARETWDVVW